MKNQILSLFLLLSTQALANPELNIDQDHLHEITGNNEATYKPVALAVENIAPESNRVGARKKIVITYDQIASSNISTTWKASPNGQTSYDLYSQGINEAIKNNLKMTSGHKISIEYLVTNNFSLELSDTYRAYQMEGQQVGYMNGGLTGGTQPVTLDNYDEFHDIQIGAKYAINLIDTANVDLDLIPQTSVGVVHVKSDSTLYYGVGQKDEQHYNGVGGYSYGAGIGARATFLDRFFIEGSVEYRNYVLAPTKDKNGQSQEIDQNGVMAYFGVGFKF